MTEPGYGIQQKMVPWEEKSCSLILKANPLQNIEPETREINLKPPTKEYT